MADIAGKMINAHISSEPTRFMAKTITTAITTASSKLYCCRFCADGARKRFVKRYGEQSIVENHKDGHGKNRHSDAKQDVGGRERQDRSGTEQGAANVAR